MTLLINDFRHGWINRARHDLMFPTAVYVATNVNFDDTGAIKCRKRHGRHEYFGTSTYATPMNNVYKLDVEGVGKQLIYYATSAGLYRWNSTTNVTTLVSSALTSARHISFAASKPELSSYTYVYMTDGITMLADNGTVSKTWGIDPPESAVNVSVYVTTGQLTAGDYSYVYTFYDDSTGSESDPSPACAAIRVTANQSILVENMEVSTNSRVTSRRLYRTIANGGTRYLVAIIPDNVVKEYLDVIPDASLTIAATTDQGVPPLGDVVIGLKNTLFMCGDSNYHNRLYFCVDRNPDNWPTTYYVEAGHGGVVIQNGVVLEGKLHLITKTGVIGVRGNDPDNYDTDETKAAQGTYARWSCVSVGGGIYYLARNGVYRFDGVRSENVSSPIEKLFWDSPTSLYPVIDRDTAPSVCRATGYMGSYYLKVPLKDSDGAITNQVLEFNPIEQQWRLIDTPLDDVFGDDSKGVLIGSHTGGSVFSLIDGDIGSSDDVIGIEVVTKNYDFTAAPEHPVKSPEVAYGMTASRVSEVAWVKEFRIDARGTWTFEFFVDGVSRHSATLTDMAQTDAQVWRNFPSRIKGRYLYVKCTATGAGPRSHELREIEVR